MEEDIRICHCNYTLIGVPHEQLENFKLPKHDVRYKKALSLIKKYKMIECILTVDLNSNTVVTDPNTSLAVSRQISRHNSAHKIKKGHKLFIRDIEIINKLSKPNKI